jgi:hypothetical protein
LPLPATARARSLLLCTHTHTHTHTHDLRGPCCSGCVDVNRSRHLSMWTDRVDSTLEEASLTVTFEAEVLLPPTTPLTPHHTHTHPAPTRTHLAHAQFRRTLTTPWFVRSRTTCTQHTQSHLTLTTPSFAYTHYIHASRSIRSDTHLHHTHTHVHHSRTHTHIHHTHVHTYTAARSSERDRTSRDVSQHRPG